MEDKQLTESQLQALLRLKSHEQPPPGYFDDLLTRIHRRQREELLRRPAWRIFAGRVRAFFSSLDWRYTASMAGVLLVGVGAIQLALPNRAKVRGSATARNSEMDATVGGLTASAFAPATGAAMPGSQPMLTLDARDPLLEVRQIHPVTPASLQAGMSGPTRFMIETQPASYEPAQIRF